MGKSMGVWRKVRKDVGGVKKCGEGEGGTRHLGAVPCDREAIWVQCNLGAVPFGRKDVWARNTFKRIFNHFFVSFC